jgi:hypothetical protein
LIKNFNPIQEKSEDHMAKMYDVRDNLIYYYSNFSLNQLNFNNDFLDLCEKYIDNIYFNNLRNYFENINKYLEDTLTNKSPSTQVSEALKFLYKAKKSEKKSITINESEDWNQFIVKWYYKNWSNKQKKYYDFISKLLLDSKFEYFLSFSGRHNGDPHSINLVNSNYIKFIKDVLGSHNINKTDLNNTNLLAKSIDYLLKHYNYTGFYYLDHCEDNDYPDEKIEKACKNCLVFIQIIQNILFTVPANDKPNYCFTEYKHMNAILSPNDHIHRMVFILAEDSRDDLVNDFQVSNDYTTWYNHVNKIDPVVLNFPRNQKDVTDLKEKIKSLIAGKIKNYIKNLIDSAPY